MPSLLVQGGSILGTEDEEDAAVAEIFTSVDPLTQDRHQPYRKIYFGRKCLFVLLGVVCLTTVLVLVTIFLVNNDDLLLKLSSKDDDVNDIVSSLPQCSPIDTSQLWTPKHQALVVGLGRSGQQSDTDSQVMEIVANTSDCKEPPRVPVCREGMVAIDLEEKVVICGGNECGYVEPRKECWHLRNFNHTDGRPTTQGWRSEEFLGLSQGRSGASGVLTDQGWWVTGGLVQPSSAATELLELPMNQLNQSFIEGPELPFAIHKHCALQVAQGLTLIIGGIAPTSPPATLATSLLYNWTSKSWCRMGELVSPRAGLSCALLTKSAEVIVFGGAAGGSANNQGELLSLASQTWQKGPLLPDNLSLRSSHLSALPDQKVLLAGVGNISSQVFSLTEAGWKEEAGLKQGRQDALFFEVGEKHLLCDDPS